MTTSILYNLSNFQITPRKTTSILFTYTYVKSCKDVNDYRYSSIPNLLGLGYIQYLYTTTYLSVNFTLVKYRLYRCMILLLINIYTLLYRLLKGVEKIIIGGTIVKYIERWGRGLCIESFLDDGI